jgi:hypothetical protein
MSPAEIAAGLQPSAGGNPFEGGSGSTTSQQVLNPQNMYADNSAAAEVASDAQPEVVNAQKLSDVSNQNTDLQSFGNFASDLSVPMCLPDEGPMSYAAYPVRPISGDDFIGAAINYGQALMDAKTLWGEAGPFGVGMQMDCSHFVNFVETQALQQQVTYVDTKILYNNLSPDYTEVTGSPQTGDIIVQWLPTSDGKGAGHMGVYSGTTDAAGNPQGYEFGSSNKMQLGSFGPNAVNWPFAGQGAPVKYFRPNL